MSDRPLSVFSTATRKKKLFTTALIYYGIFSHGLIMTSLNPTSLDFARKFGIEVDDLAIVFTVLTAVYIVGALLAGILLKFVSRPLFVISAFVLMTGSYFAVPFAESKTTLCVFAAIMGLGGGGFDCAQLAWVIDIWRHEAGPFILIEGFAYSLGTLITPLIFSPYLTDEDEDETGTTPIPETGTSPVPISSSSSAPFESRLTTPFMIGGSLIALSLVMQVVLYFVYRNAPVNQTELRKIDEELKRKASVVSETTSKAFVMPPDSRMRKIVLTILCVVVGCFYQGLELSTGSFLPIFAHYSPVKFSDAAGARLSFGMQLGFAAGRFSGIFIVLKIAPHFIIVTSLTLLAAANTILLAVGGSDAKWLWVGAVMFGVGESCVYPALCAYVEKYLFITDQIASMLLVCGGTLSAVFPLIIGDSIKDHPGIMTYVNFFSIAACSASFAILFWITFVRERRFKKRGRFNNTEAIPNVPTLD